MIFLPSGNRQRDLIIEVCSVNMDNCSKVAMFQTLMVLSAEADIILELSGETETPVTVAVWPSNVPKHSYVDISQTFTELSAEPDINFLPLGEINTE